MINDGLNRATRKALFAGVEDSYGIEAPDLAYTPCYNENNIIQPASEVRQFAAFKYWGSRGNGSTAHRYTINPTFYLHGSGSPLTPPRWMDLLQCAGFKKSVDLNMVRYNTSLRYKSATMYAYLDDVLHMAVGSRGEFAFSGSAGEIVQAAFRGSGLYSPREIVATPSFTVEDALFPVACGLNFTIQAMRDGTIITPKIKSFAIAMQNPLTLRKYANQSSNLDKVDIGNALDITWSSVVEIYSEYDFVEAHRTSEKFKLSMSVGTGAGRQIGFSVPGWAQLNNAPTYGEWRDGLRVQNLEFGLFAEDDNQLEITHS